MHFNFLAGHAGFQMNAGLLPVLKRVLVRLVSPHFLGRYFSGLDRDYCCNFS